MKPDWKDAPEWANYLAMEKNGDWYWYLRKPIRQDECWWCGGGKFEFAKRTGVYWKDSLEKRPGVSTTSVDV